MKPQKSLPLVLALFVIATSSIHAQQATNEWPQFRGPSAGRSETEQPLPTEIGPEQNVLWKTPLPGGHSSPVVVKDRIFLTAVRDKEHLETICLDRGSGKILWRVEAPHAALAIERNREPAVPGS